MNKSLLFNQVLTALTDTYLGAVDAANRAHATATNDESIAENKYDTFGLEASYLAVGQSQRVAQCKADIDAFKTLIELTRAEQHSVRLGSLIVVIDDNDVKHYFLLAPSAGGLKLAFDNKEIICITPSTPIGLVLQGKEVDDEVAVSIGCHTYNYEIIALY